MLKTVDTIYDNVHGFTPITEIERELTYSSTFGRLRYVKQMGLASLVFPGAEHTRFSHSLGVMHIAGRILASRGEPDPHEQTLRACALLHDLGHLPLSHALEGVLAEDLDQKRRAEAQRDFLVAHASSLEDDTAVAAESAGGYASEDHRLHEELGKELILSPEIATILEKHGLSPELVAATCTGVPADSEAPASPSEAYLVGIMGRMLHSQADADRIDYLMRDAKSSGLDSSGFDVQKLLKEVRWADSGGGFGFQVGGLRAIEQFLFARMANFRRIALNKHVQGLEFMASEVYRYGLREKFAADFTQIVEWARKGSTKLLQRINDHYMSYLIVNVADRTIDHPAVEYAQYLRKHQAPHRVLTEEYYGTREDWESQCKSSNIADFLTAPKAVCDEAGAPQHHVFLVASRPFSLIKARGEDPIQIYWHGEFKDILDLPQSTVRGHSGQELFLRRLYTLTREEAVKVRAVLGGGGGSPAL